MLAEIRDSLIIVSVEIEKGAAWAESLEILVKGSARKRKGEKKKWP